MAHIDFSFLRKSHALVLSSVLLCQAGLIHVLTPPEKVPPGRPLRELPLSIGDWNLLQEGFVDQATEAVLKADDSLSRSYSDSGNHHVANLFIAFFRTQRAGVSPHSPQVCLPGAGWISTSSSMLRIQIRGRSEPITVNRYVVAKGDEKSLVLYWYQTPKRVIASEYAAKFYTILDGIRYHRSDTSLVRIIVPVEGSESAAESVAVQFAETVFEPIRSLLPS